MFAYDSAGQLQTITGPDGSRVEFVHDGLGRRTRRIKADGSWAEYAWGPTGHLSGTCDRTPDGDVTSRHELWVDALGELAGIDGTHFWWDTAHPVPTLTGIAGVGVGAGQVLSLPGGVTGIGEAWTASGWRAARPTDETDPWAVLGTTTIPVPTPTLGGTAGGSAGAGSGTLGAGAGLAGELPVGVSLTGHGGVDIAGLEWLGARAYDPTTRGFLSTDPLAPVLGAGWDGNLYAYAGNNPLNTTDPTGLRPLTDDELKAYDGSAGGAIAAVEKWADENAYLVAGIAIVAGVALMCTGVGGPVGMAVIGAASGALISGGASVGTQKFVNRKVDWGKVGVETAVGAVGGFAGGAAAGLLNRGANAARSAVSAGSASSAVARTSTVLSSSTARASLATGVGGSSSNIAAYTWQKDQKRTVGGYVQTAVAGFATGAGGSFMVGRMSPIAGSSVADRLPGLDIPARVVPRHAAGPLGYVARHAGEPGNWGSLLAEQGVDRAGGILIASLNTELQPGEALQQEQVNAVVQGFLGGSSAPSVGLHASR
ncbi:RHS repeat-associated core domain-containing protein [Arthrobacter pityocampae]|uniref:RHS repeat-associated core domain-containing protein n=1 Tax=Arthrobacter pityocampae TaxID=547334 RepID=UPI0037358299